MPTSGSGFAQCDNARASVDVDTMVIVGRHLSQHPNDKLEIQPALSTLRTLPEALRKVGRLLADTGTIAPPPSANAWSTRFSHLTAAKATRTTRVSKKERFAELEPLPDPDDAVTEMKHCLKTQTGRALYGKRKSTVEPVFGIIKTVMGFRQFLLRGVEAVCGEWDLVCMAAWNLKQFHALGA